MGHYLDHDCRIVAPLHPLYERFVYLLEGRENPSVLFEQIVDAWVVFFYPERDASWVSEMWSILSDSAEVYFEGDDPELSEKEMERWSEVTIIVGRFVEEHLRDINQWLWHLTRGRPDEWQDPTVNHITRTITLHRFIQNH